MSEYSLMRSKKNAEMVNAMANIRKDLYEWKPSSPNFFKLTKNNSQQTPPQRLKSIDSMSNRSLLHRSDSLKDLNQKPVINSKNNQLQARAHSTQIKKNVLDLNIEDFNEIDDEKAYLNSSRNSKLLIVKKTQEEIDAEMISKLDIKDPKSVFELDLSQCNIKTMINLQKFINLKFLDYSCNQILKLDNLKSFKNLIELRLYANQIETIENLENLTELQSLQLQANQIKKLNKGLIALKKLEYLRLDQNELENIATNEILSCSNLIYLNISHNKIDSLTFINYLPNLEELDASYLNLKRLDDIDSSRCKKLTELDLSSNCLTDESFSGLENFSNLNTLKIASNKLKSVKIISNIRFLRNLDVSSNQIELVEDLKKLKELETLDISKNKINQWSQIEKLVLCNQLVELQFLNNPICDENSEKNALYRLPNLKIVNEIVINSSNNNKSEKLNSAKNMFFMQVDLQTFEQEMEIYNQNFLKKFTDIKQTLNSIMIENDATRNDGLKPKQDEPIKRSSAAASRKTSKNRLIDALKFSKQLS